MNDLDRVRRHGDEAGRRAEAGFSFLEATIASIMVLMLAWLIATLSIDGMRAQKYAERQARVTEIAQDVVDEMRRGLGSAVRVFGSDVVGTAYRDMLQLGAAFPQPIRSSRLPAIEAGGRLELEDPLLPRTGNELMFARYAWTDEFTVSGGNTYRIDVYRVERWFLTAAGLGPRRDRPDGLNLSRWVSEPLADGSQVDRIADPADQAEVLVHMHDQTPDDTGTVRDAVEVVWLVGEDPATAGTFRQVGAAGDLAVNPSLPRPAGAWVLLHSERLANADILDYRHHSVATNFAPTVYGVGRFGIVDRLGAGFPHGFEVQVVGAAAARQILIHLTLVSTIETPRRSYHDMQVVVDMRDL